MRQACDQDGVPGGGLEDEGMIAARNHVTEAQVMRALSDGQWHGLGELRAAFRCGDDRSSGLLPTVKRLVRAGKLEERGVHVGRYEVRKA